MYISGPNLELGTYITFFGLQALQLPKIGQANGPMTPGSTGPADLTAAP